MRDNYHSSEGISRSQLFHISKSPEYFKYMQDNPSKSTSDMILGAAFHKILLEPDDFDNEYIIAPEVDRRTKQGKAVYAEFEAQLAAGLTAVSQADFLTISAMRDSVMKSDLARALLQGTVETPVYWTDKITGELCKCKPDVLTEAGNTPIIVDLKTCRHADTDSFMRACFRYGYDLQAAMYKEGCDLIAGGKHEFVFVAVEKTPPYSVNIMQADDFFIEHGGRLFRKYMDIYHDCKATGNWYGYGGKANMINTLSTPSWMVPNIG